MKRAQIGLEQAYDQNRFIVSRKPIKTIPIDDLLTGGDINPKPIERKPIEDLPIGGGAAGGMNIPKLPEIKNKQVEPAKKNNLPMIIGVVVIGAILYFFYKKK